MPCRAGVYAPHYSRFIMKDGLAFNRGPVAAERAVTRVEWDRIQQLKFLSERATGSGFEFGQLISYNSGKQMTDCPLSGEDNCYLGEGGRYSSWKVWMKRAYLLCQYVKSYSSRYVWRTSSTDLIVGAASGKGCDAEPRGVEVYW